MSIPLPIGFSAQSIIPGCSSVVFVLSSSSASLETIGSRTVAVSSGVSSGVSETIDSRTVAVSETIGSRTVAVSSGVSETIGSRIVEGGLVVSDWVSLSIAVFGSLEESPKISGISFDSSTKLGRIFSAISDFLSSSCSSTVDFSSSSFVTRLSTISLPISAVFISILSISSFSNFLFSSSSSTESKSKLFPRGEFLNISPILLGSFVCASSPPSPSNNPPLIGVLLFEIIPIPNDVGSISGKGILSHSSFHISLCHSIPYLFIFCLNIIY